LENSKAEVSAVSEVLAREKAAVIRELAELELVLVGGGYGETIL
jgi:hypothetical protein